MYLKRGDSGTEVKQCQYTLHILTYNVNGIDGSFGPGMVSAVTLYQQNNGISATGIIDTTTWNSLVKNITTIKVQLRARGYYPVATLYGVADATLYDVVVKFQRDNGLSADGMVGPATRVKLFSQGTGGTVVGDDEFPLKQGDKGDNVLYLQYGLHVLGCAPGSLDGSFGPAVDTAVRWFQQKYGLGVNGIVGDSTWYKMKALIREIQQKLLNLGEAISIVNGIAGPETYNAVCSFQRKNGLAVDGAVGPATRNVLFSTSSGTGTTGIDDLPLVYGSTGKNVERFQYGLHICGINPSGFDGSFGPGMQNAVRTFQSKYGLSVDGSVGPATWNKMLEIIKPIQQALKAAGYYAWVINGEPGLNLYSSLISFQRDHGLSADGMYGPATQAALGITSGSTSTGTGTVSAVLVKGSNGSLVRYLQKMLNTTGYTLTVDGSFGPTMESVVKRWQSDHGITADGSFGPATWKTFFMYYVIPEMGKALNGDRLAKVAEYELAMGFSEDNANDITPYGEWYGMNGQPWCAMFVSWCAWQSGYIDTKVPKYAYCPYGKNWFVQRGRYAARNSNYKPMRGDIIFYWNGSEISHTGIVVSSTATTVTAIEGNASRMVKMSTYSLTNTYIDGYGIFDPDAVKPNDRPENPNLPTPDNKEYVPPAKESNANMMNIMDMVDNIKALEQMAYDFSNRFGKPPLAERTYLACVLTYLKSLAYSGDSFDITSGMPVDGFYDYVTQNNPALHEAFYPYIAAGSRSSLRDNIDGVIDFPHLAVTIGGHTIGISGELVTQTMDWTGWAGDLATGIKNTYAKATKNSSTDYQRFADETIGSVDSECNYSDLCTDSDAIKIAELINADPQMKLSSALTEYYTDWVDCRYSYLYARISSDNWQNPYETDLDEFTEKVNYYFTNPVTEILGKLLELLGDAKGCPEVITAGCRAFAKYIFYYM